MSSDNNIMGQKVTDYINKLESLHKEIMEKLRILIQSSAPLAQETMSYGVPAYKLNGRYLVAYAAFKQHIGLYPEPETIRYFQKELKKYKTSKGAIQFSLNQPIPYDLIEKIVEYKYAKLADRIS